MVEMVDASRGGNISIACRQAEAESSIQHVPLCAHSLASRAQTVICSWIAFRRRPYHHPLLETHDSHDTSHMHDAYDMIHTYEPGAE